MKSIISFNNNKLLFGIFGTLFVIIGSVIIGSSFNIREDFEDSVVPTQMTRVDNKKETKTNTVIPNYPTEQSSPEQPSVEQPSVEQPQPSAVEQPKIDDIKLENSIKEALKDTIPVTNKTQENMTITDNKDNNDNKNEENEEKEENNKEIKKETINDSILNNYNLTTQEKELFDQITKNMLSTSELDKLIQAGVLTDKLIEKFLKQIDTQISKEDGIEAFCADKNCYTEL